MGNHPGGRGVRKIPLSKASQDGVSLHTVQLLNLLYPGAGHWEKTCTIGGGEEDVPGSGEGGLKNAQRT